MAPIMFHVRQFLIIKLYVNKYVGRGERFKKVQWLSYSIKIHITTNVEFRNPFHVSYNKRSIISTRNTLFTRISSVVVVKPFLSLCFAFIFVRAILVFKIKCYGRLSVFVCRLKLSNATSFICSDPRTTINYSEPRFHESFVMNSLAASPVNGLDESDNAKWHKSVLGDECRWGAVVRQHSACEHS